MGDLTDHLEKLADENPELAPKLRPLVAAFSPNTLAGMVHMAQTAFFRSVFAFIEGRIARDMRGARTLRMTADDEDWIMVCLVPVPGAFYDAEVKFHISGGSETYSGTTTVTVKGSRGSSAGFRVEELDTPDRVGDNAHKAFQKLLSAR